ncbi:hypothetical protein [Actinomadura sp. 21ATH]|uniref:hypothetical protein n=1 Tax=Actinomadura sp. 21ATH TaxID=1735444 RepID=UPI0035C1991D
MILHRPYHEDSDALTKIKDDLETQETVAALRAQGLQDDTFDGYAVQAVRPPLKNYAVGHGIAGMMIDQPLEDRFAANLAARGIQGGDEIVLIVCFAGEPGGAAQKLADELGRLGLVGVKVTGAVHFVHWTSQGALPIKRYPSNDAVRAAERGYTKAEDNAWKSYVTALKAAAAVHMATALKHGEDIVVARVLRFAGARPDDNRAKLNAAMTAAKTGTNTGAALRDIIMRSEPDYVYDSKRIVLRPLSHERWSAELRALLTDLSVLADPAGGAIRAETDITEARDALRNSLKAAWPAYSSGYLDGMRALLTPDATGEWASYTSAAVRSIAPPPQQPTAQPPQRTLEETRAAEALDLDEIDALIRELGGGDG